MAKESVIPKPLANLVRLLAEIVEVMRLTDDPQMLVPFIAHPIRPLQVDSSLL